METSSGISPKMDSVNDNLNMQKDADEFREFVMEDQWDKVIAKYKADNLFHKINIKRRGTALHVAVSNDNKHVKSLVSAILDHKNESALTLSDGKGATPLHLAAYRGFTRTCECIIGENGERKRLIGVKNEKGETPLFWAVLGRQRLTFVYLQQFYPNDKDVVIRDNGDSILHVAIQREMFDLANIILYCYHHLSDQKNHEGVTPFEVLATRTSAFPSGMILSPWKWILYHCIYVTPRDAESRMQSYRKQGALSKGAVKNAKDENEISIQLWHVDALEKADEIPTPLKCFSIFRFLYRWLLSRLHLKTIKTMKRKHICGEQLLKAFMKDPYQSYMGLDETNLSHQEATEKTFANFIAEEREKVHSQNTTKEKTRIIEIEGELHSKGPCSDYINHVLNNIQKEQNEEIDQEDFILKKVDKMETAYLIAAKHGIVEIMNALQSKIKSVIYETNSDNENVLLLAVKHRQPRVVEMFQKSFTKKVVFGLNIEVDKRANTMLHLAAGSTSDNENTWRIAGSAMQMMWDIKWYKYIKGIVPEHFNYRSNKDGKTPSEIFKEEHKELLKSSIDWLKDTAESCSVVAALIAGVSFATSGSVPGGNESSGKPAYEGEPAFDVFAMGSLLGLYFSVTALIMFLSILTSRKSVEDFRKSLPLKLLFGLSSLFVSIASMLVAFCAGHFFVLKDQYKGILFPLYVATCIPVTFYAIVQFPLYVDLVKVILKRTPPPTQKGVHL